MTHSPDVEAARSSHRMWAGRERKWNKHGRFGSPLIRDFFHLLLDHGTPATAISDASGIPTVTISRWRRGQVPNLANFDAALSALGYQLKIVKMEE